MSSVKLIKKIIFIVISFCFLFTFSFLTACGGSTSTEEVSPVEETVDREIGAEEEEEEEKEEVVEEEEVAEEEVIYEIAFFSDHGSPASIYTCMPDGSDLKKVYDSGFDELEPCWNSEHNKIVFPSNMDGDGDNDLFVIDLTNGEISGLTDREGYDFHPNYGPDRSVALAGAVVKPEEGNFDILPTAVLLERKTDRVGCDRSPNYGPDGSIVFAGYVDNFEIHSTASPIKQLTDDPAWDGWPHYSPDGKTIIFTSDRSGYGKLYIMDTEGNNLVQITNSGEWWDRDGTFSPDGKNIVFVSDRSGNEDIWVMPVDNPDAAVNLTNNPANDVAPDWSPDGSMIVFASDRDAAEVWMFDIFTMDANGENQTNITPDLADSYQDAPSW